MVLYFLATVVLARILSPYEFGVMAIISILIGVSGIFFENTLGAALVHAEKADPGFSGAVFASAMMLGLLLTLMMFLTANEVAGYFDMPEITEISRNCSIVFLFNAMQVVPYALMQREGDFRGIGRVELIATATGAAAAIAAAIGGLGIWSLVLLVLLTSLMKGVLFMIFSGWSVTANLERDSLRSLWRYCSGLLGANTFNYLAMSIDQVLVGKLFGASSLGAYRLATQLVTLPQMIMTQSANRVFFHRYKQTSAEAEIRGIHLRLLQWTAFISYPVLIGMAVTSRDVTYLIFGERWGDMPYLMTVLAISSLFPVLGAMNLPIFLYTGATSAQFKMSLITRSLYIICMGLGATFGIEGMLYGILFARLVGFHIAFTFAGKLINMPVRQVLQTIWPALLASLIMGAGVASVRTLSMELEPSWLMFLGQVLMGVLLYGASYFILVKFARGRGVVGIGNMK